MKEVEQLNAQLITLFP